MSFLSNKSFTNHLLSKCSSTQWKNVPFESVFIFIHLSTLPYHFRSHSTFFHSLKSWNLFWQTHYIHNTIMPKHQLPLVVIMWSKWYLTQPRTTSTNHPNTQLWKIQDIQPLSFMNIRRLDDHCHIFLFIVYDIFSCPSIDPC